MFDFYYNKFDFFTTITLLIIMWVNCLFFEVYNNNNNDNPVLIFFWYKYGKVVPICNNIIYLLICAIISSEFICLSNVLLFPYLSGLLNQ